MRRIRSTLRSLLFVALLLWSVIRQRALAIRHVAGDGLPKVHLTPDGRYMPVIAGADPEDEDDDDDEEEEDEDSEDDDSEDEDEDEDEEPEPEFQGDFDPERAKRAIAAERAKRKREKRKLQKRAQEAEARARELEQAQESDQERTVRERDEARAEAERARATADKLRVDIAIREAAAEAGVPNSRMRRVLRLIDRDEIEVDGEDVEGVEDAVAALLEDIPELKGAPAKPSDDDEEADDNEAPGGKPDRKRKPRTLTAKQARKLAKDDPKRFNQLFEEGKIPKEALGA